MISLPSSMGMVGEKREKEGDLHTERALLLMGEGLKGGILRRPPSLHI